MAVSVLTGSGTSLLLLMMIGVQRYKENVQHGGVRADAIVPGLPKKRFKQLADVNIGVLLPMTRGEIGSYQKFCTERPSVDAMVIYAEAVRYAVKRVNEDHPLPHNLSLGFVVLNDCSNVAAAAAQALAFVPKEKCSSKINQSVGPHDPQVQESYDVVAVIGAIHSASSLAATTVLGPARIPLISFYSTSDDLSNKALYPYFMRVIPPNRYQMQAIYTLIKHLNWTYVSVMYVRGNYGENAFKSLQNLFAANGICMATVHKVSGHMSRQEAEAVAADLVTHRRARCVVAIINRRNAMLMANATAQLVQPGTFNWIASDAWGMHKYPTKNDEMLLDTFSFHYRASRVPEFEDWFLQLTLNATGNPWFPYYWQKTFNCSFVPSTFNASISRTCNASLSLNDSGISYDSRSDLIGHVLDIVSVIANASSRVLHSTQCAGRTPLRACIPGYSLLQQLLATHQNGYSGWLEFDANGDRHGHVSIQQFRPARSKGEALTTVTVAEFATRTETMGYINTIKWLRNKPREGYDHPESQCSDPCKAKERPSRMDISCCWTCVACSANEYPTYDGTRCVKCRDFFWPETKQANVTCTQIQPTTPRMDTVSGAIQIALALLCLVATFVVLVFFLYHIRSKVIKASSRELCFLMLLGIAIGFTTIIMLLAPPTGVTCRISFFMFCVSFTLLYGPLLVRAVRIFRIFNASKRTPTRPRMTNSTPQLLFSFSLFFVQVVACIIVTVLHTPWHKKTQPSPLKAYVELTCDFPNNGLLSFVAFNLMLVVSCTLLAFKTRHLPDNFNESRFIVMCVCTTVVIVVCFIPAYLVSSSELLKLVMLALASGLNHTVALIFLFLPKIYAVLYLEGAAECLQTVAGRTMMQNTSEPVSPSSARKVRPVT